jgi:hypothetical protein
MDATARAEGVQPDRSGGPHEEDGGRQQSQRSGLEQTSWHDAAILHPGGRFGMTAGWHDRADPLTDA